MTHKSPPDEQAIGKIYQQLEKPQPGQHLDKAILELAKQGAGNEMLHGDIDRTVVKKPVSILRRWQWPLGLAASAGLVWVILQGQLQRFEPMLPPDEALTMPPTADWQAEPAPESTQLKDRQAISAPDPSLLDDSVQQEEVQLAFKPEMTDFKAQAEQERIAERKQLQQEVQAELSEEVEKADPQLALNIELEDPLFDQAQDQEQQVEMIVVTGSRINEQEIAASEEQAMLAARLEQRQRAAETAKVQPARPAFLEALYQDYLGLESSELTEKNRQIKRQEIRQAIYDYLWQLRLINPQQVKSEPILSILSEAQQRSLKSGEPIQDEGAQ